MQGSSQQTYVSFFTERVSVFECSTEVVSKDCRLHRFSAEGAVPTLGKVAGFEYFFSPSVVNAQLHLRKTLSAPDKEDVVYTVVVGGEGGGHEEAEAVAIDFAKDIYFDTVFSRAVVGIGDHDGIGSCEGRVGDWIVNARVIQGA